MAHCGGFCGIEIDCPNGCGALCTTDCTDCTQWCEPTTLPQADTGSPGVMVRVSRQGGEPNVRVIVGENAMKPPVGASRYSANTEFKLSFNDLPRSSLARLLSSMHARPVQAPAGLAAERLSGSATGTIQQIAERFSLVVEQRQGQ
jgi:hypothetical protein